MNFLWEALNKMKESEEDLKTKQVKGEKGAMKKSHFL